MNNIGRILLTSLTSIFIANTPISAKDLTKDNNNGMIIRILEIEVYPEYLEEYLKYAKEVALMSVKNEKDVVSIYPMQVIKNNNLIRILEIYKNQDAYKKHIASPHFKKYKEGTVHMVKHLELIDTYHLCPENFNKIFKRAQ